MELQKKGMAYMFDEPIYQPDCKRHCDKYSYMAGAFRLGKEMDASLVG